MTTALLLGRNCKLYKNGATWGSPTWGEVKNVQDVALNDDMEEADVSVRQFGTNLSEPTGEGVSIEWNAPRVVGDTVQEALMDAYVGRTMVDLAVAEGDISVTGTRYWRGECKLFSKKGDEALKSAKMLSFVAKPCFPSDPTHIPGFFTASGS